MTPKFIIIHHSGGSDANPLQDSSNFTVQECNALHKQKFNMKSSLGWYVGYQYFIDKNGVITQCRADTEEGAHTIGQNKNSIGVVLAGNFDATLPTESQKNSLRWLLDKKVKEHNIPTGNIVPHRLFAKKTCYGKLLNDTWAKDLLNQRVTPVTPPAKKVDSITPLVSKLVSQISLKDYKGAKDTTTNLLSELTKII